jgi:integrase
VFHRPNGKLMSKRTIRDNCYAMLEKAEPPRIRVHDLRRLQGSFLLEQGADLAGVSARRGHSSEAFTLNTCVHALASGQEKAAAISNSLLAANELQPVCNPT